MCTCSWNMNILLLLLLAVCLPSVWLMERTALDDYVAQPDPHYTYTLKKKEDWTDITVYRINMTSGKWLNESEVDRSIWWHRLTIVVSKTPKMTNSCLLITRMENNILPRPLSDFDLLDIIGIARSTGSCVALLAQIPNQPITFLKIPVKKCKFSFNLDVLACSVWNFINDKTAQPHTLLLFPMVKATVRAMDTISDFMLKESGGQRNISRFTLAGLSLRSWTDWLTAAVDKRVVSLFSILFDALNFHQYLHHQYQAYCGWSFVLKSLYDVNLTRYVDSPRFKEMLSYSDPLEFSDRYTNISKYIVIATGDEFFLPYNSYFYMDQLKGEINLRIVPNTDHYVVTSLPTEKCRILDALGTFYFSTMQNLKRPQISWNRTETNTTGTIYLFTDQEPLSIKSYHADTFCCSKRRDFRFLVAPGLPQPVLWFPSGVEKVKTGIYKKEMQKPSKAWRGFFIEVTFWIPEVNNEYVLTTELLIIPDTYPCADCKGEQCYGKLV